MKNIKNINDVKDRIIIWGFFLSILAIMWLSPRLVSYGSKVDLSQNDIKVSIIVPVYNTEKYLDECLETLENQTLKEIEIICVNDGSKDGSLQILQNHAKKDSRIKVIDQKNSGVSVTRNNGLKAARGEYVIFCDSDDLIPPYAYQKAYEDAVRYGVDVVGLKLMAFIEGQETVDVNSFEYDSSKVRRCARKGYQNPFYYMLENSSYMVTKMFRRSFLIDNNLFFKEGVTNYEDGLFNFMVFPHVTEMVQDDNIFYCYRACRPNSAATVFNVKRVLGSTMIATQELLNNINIFNFQKSDEWVFAKIMDLNYNHITKDIPNPEEKKYYAGTLIKILDEYMKDHNPNIPQWIKNQIEDLRKISKE